MGQTHLDRIAIVTGAAGGIGAAIAAGLAARGASVGIVDVADAADTVEAIKQAGGRAHAVRANIADPDAAEAAVTTIADALGPVDILVNNAAIGRLGAVDEIDIDSWRTVLDVNVTGTFAMSRAVVPGMKELGHGRIVSVASTSIYTNTPRMVAYMTSKAAILGLTSSLAADLGPAGITVNAVSPGFTHTPMVEEQIRAGAMPPNIADIMRGMQALPRTTSVEDVVGAVAYLTGPDAGMVTGQFLAADGGLTRHF
ncbi:SDR family NAD(P)-dependent oxidoreductase [Gordonia sp. NPDC003424]